MLHINNKKANINCWYTTWTQTQNEVDAEFLSIGRQLPNGSLKGSRATIAFSRHYPGETQKNMDSSSKFTSEDFVVDSNEAVEFKLIKEASDINNESIIFKPVMSHQIFGAQETIFGYKNLKVSIYFSAGQLNPYLNVSYSEKVDPKKHDSVEADNIPYILNEKLEIKFNQNIDEFIHSLEKEVKFKPPGELKESIAIEDEDPDSVDGGMKERVFEIYYSEITTPGLIKYHERLQTFALWYIDAASFIDVDDEKWKFFLVFEKYKRDGDNMYAVAGYAAVYEYYAYPVNIRPRISQVLILPPFQRKGLGAGLLSAIYNHYKLISNVTDITAEDPSEDFQLVRDYVDCKNVMALDSFQPEALWSRGFTSELISEATTKFKINKRQARRIYEILKLKTVKKDNEDQYKKYRLEVKRRLNLPSQNEQNKLKKLEAYMKPQEIAEIKAAFILSDEQRLSNLDKSYKQLEALYERVINRLNEN